MEPCETVFLGLLELAFLLRLASSELASSALVVVPASSALLLHLWADGRRWQLYPAYAVAAALVVALVFDEALSPAGSALAWVSFWTLALAGQAALLVSAVCSFLLPVPRLLPLPADAPFKVGTMHLHLEDASRPEWEGHHDSGNRQIMVQVFYPTRGAAIEVAGGENGPAPELDSVSTVPSTYYRQLERFGPGLAAQGRMPGFIADHMRYVKVHALRHAACASPEQERPRGWPVLIFSHGFSGYGTQNYQLMEQLACRGYVVVGVDHTYDCCATVLSNGEVRGFEARLPLDKPAEEIFRIRRAHLEIRAADVRFVMDSLAQVNKGEAPPTSSLCPEPNEHWRTLSGKLEAQRFGLFGHSFGGATSVLAAELDPRVDRVLGLDAWMFPLDPELRARGIASQPGPDGRARPLEVCMMEAPMFFAEDMHISRDNRAQCQELLRNTVAPGRRVSHIQLKGTKHHSFCDLPILVSPHMFSLLKMDFGSLPNSEVQRAMLQTCLGIFSDEGQSDPKYLEAMVSEVPAVAFTRL